MEPESDFCDRCTRPQEEYLYAIVKNDIIIKWLCEGCWFIVHSLLGQMKGEGVRAPVSEEPQEEYYDNTTENVH